MMTEDERRLLREIERGLMTTDPKLVLLMSGGTYRRPARRRRRATVVMLDLLALAMIVLSAATGSLVLIFVSSLATVLAVGLHVVRRRARTV